MDDQANKERWTVLGFALAVCVIIGLLVGVAAVAGGFTWYEISRLNDKVTAIQSEQAANRVMMSRIDAKVDKTYGAVLILGGDDGS